MEVMSKVISRNDAKNNRLEFPMGNLRFFTMPADQNSIEFTALDAHAQEYRLKVSVRNEGKYLKPWMSGAWGRYAREKGLRKGDRVTLTVHEQENGERHCRITAERRIFGAWFPMS